MTLNNITEIHHNEGDLVGCKKTIGGFAATCRVVWIGRFIRKCRKHKQQPPKYLIHFRGNKNPSRINQSDMIWPRFKIGKTSLMAEIEKIRHISCCEPKQGECPSCFNRILWPEDDNRNALSRTDSKTEICFPCSQLEHAYGIKKGDSMSFLGYDPDSGAERWRASL